MADFADRIPWEQKFADAVHRQLNGSLDALMRYLGDPPDPSNVPESFWRAIGQELKPVILKSLTDIYLESARALYDELAQQAAFEFSWGLVDKGAANWATRYTDQLVKDLYQTNIDGTGALVNLYHTEGWTMGDLEARLAELFGRGRAELIATTEVTRAAVEGERGTVDEIESETGWNLPEVWQTEKDELVCDICGPLDGLEKGDGWDESDGPPAHPRCRCWTIHRLPELSHAD